MFRFSEVLASLMELTIICTIWSILYQKSCDENMTTSERTEFVTLYVMSTIVWIDKVRQNRLTLLCADK